MTKVLLDQRRNYFGVIGHSGYGEKGKDIVCAAVSILTYTIFVNLRIMELNKLIKDLDISIDKDRALAEVRFEADENYNDGIDVLLRALCVGFKILEEDYPDNVKFKLRGR